MIMQMANFRVGVPDMGGIRGVPGITGIEELSIGLRGDRFQAARLALPPRPLAALGEGQEPEHASSEARSRGGLGGVNRRGSADLVLEWPETAIAFHLVLQLERSPFLLQPSVLAPKARRSES
jgi:hypothetical protein